MIEKVKKQNDITHFCSHVFELAKKVKEIEWGSLEVRDVVQNMPRRLTKEVICIAEEKKKTGLHSLPSIKKV